MKKNFLFLFLCLSLTSYSQIQKEIDSLYKLYNSSSKELKKHTVLYDIARKYSTVNLDSSISIFRRVIPEAKSFKNDTLIIKSQLGIALSFSRMSKYDSAHYYYKASEKILKNYKHSELEKMLYINRGILYFYQREYSKAGDEFQKALDIALEENHYEDMGRCYNNIALCRAYAGEYEKALEMHIQSANLAEKLGNKLSLAQSYNNIGLVYSDLKSFEKANEYLVKSLELKKEVGSTLDIIGSYINLGNVNRKVGSTNKDESLLTKARGYYNEALKLCKESSYIKGLNDVYVSLAYIEVSLENYDKAIDLGKKAVEFSLENKNTPNEMTARINLGDAYRYKKLYRQAKNQLLIALKMAKKSNNLFHQKEIMLILSEVYNATGEYKKAYDSHSKYFQLNDSIASSDIQNKVNELETKYQTSQKEKEIAIQKQEILDNELKLKNRNFYIVLISSALIIIIILAIGFFKRQQFKRQQLQKELDLKDALAKIRTQNKLQEQRLEISRDLHDNIGSQLTFIISSIDNLKYLSKEMNDQIKGKLSNISSFTFDTIHQLRDTIWAMNKNQITIDEFQSRIMSYIEKAKAAKPDLQFNFQNKIGSSIVLSSVVGMNLFRVVQEAINNTIKHAEASKVEISFDEKSDFLLITVKDNGKGFDKENFTSGNGLSNIENRISSIKGEVFINSKINKGTVVQVNIHKNS
ncbi:sensor histidine kinase [Pseudotenacibaculum sp. MALMAid0570]|uniref:sensor histidine kinase n=1 Tax=Pseudotenacibaculum sp. MALMAid0570 TaxID=3143938 RepID=UPI0032DE3BE8